MKMVIANTKRYLFQAAIVSVMFLAASCSKKVRFVNSTVVPAAEGRIDIDKDDNNNYTIDIDVDRLADPSRLTPARKYYIVWLETDKDGTKNLGQLKSKSGIFTNSLDASLKTVTPFKPKRVFITAEDDISIENPGSQVVLTTKSF